MATSDKTKKLQLLGGGFATKKQLEEQYLKTYVLDEGETVEDAPEWAEEVVDPFSESEPGGDVDLEAVNERLDELSEAIAGLKQNGTGGSGLTAAQISALDGMFRIASYTKDPTAEYTAFKVAFGIQDSGEVEPDEPENPDTPAKTLTSISVTYSGGDVYAGALLTDLTGITVKAIYSDGSTSNVTGYTLSGEIVEGNNTITVSYSGKTSTFTVTGLPVEEDGVTDNDPPFDALTWTDGLRIAPGGKEYTGHSNYATTGYIDVSGIDSFTVSRSDDVTGNVQYIHTFYDAEKTYIGDTGANYINANNETYPSSVIIEIPDGATYCRLCGTKLSGLIFGELIRITVD